MTWSADDWQVCDSVWARWGDVDATLHSEVQHSDNNIMG